MAWSFCEMTYYMGAKNQRLKRGQRGNDITEISFVLPSQERQLESICLHQIFPLQSRPYREGIHVLEKPILFYLSGLTLISVANTFLSE